MEGLVEPTNDMMMTIRLLRAMPSGHRLGVIITMLIETAETDPEKVRRVLNEHYIQGHPLGCSVLSIIRSLAR